MMIIPESPEALAEAVEILRSGGTVIHATETCYGLTCDLTNEDAVKDLFDVKKRPEDQPVSALFTSLESARTYVDVSPKAEELFRKHLPGPLTIVLPKKNGAPPLWLTASGGGEDAWIGVRISSHPFAARLAEAYGKPIATTSA
ncbi:MAG: L-threonylcarbamoyladenylate synthase, partial [Candidatus Peribacteraceae bacterium]|nr:L-threonylcarbamoyladenylate synthase [Candidatus Peribacteraceae bacterium]